MVTNDTQLVKAGPNAGQLIPVQTLHDYLDAFGLADKLTPAEKGMFVNVAQAYGLNPFKREIYAIPYGTGNNRKLSIITGYEVYIKRGFRSGLLKGYKVWTEGECKIEVKTEVARGQNGDYNKKVRTATGNLKACIEIKRADWPDPFYHEVSIKEYFQGNEQWEKMPETMLKKVAMAQGFRLCFPDEYGGMPYIAEEMGFTETTNGVRPPQDEPLEGEIIPPEDQLPAAEKRRRTSRTSKVAEAIKPAETVTPAPEDNSLLAVLDKIAQATTLDDLEEVGSMGQSLPDDQKDIAREAYLAKQAELED